MIRLCATARALSVISWQARIEGGRHGAGIIDFQGNQGATRHLQADPASGRAYRRHDPFADHSHRPLYRRGCCRQELPQTVLAENNEVFDPGTARFCEALHRLRARQLLHHRLGESLDQRQHLGMLLGAPAREHVGKTLAPRIEDALAHRKPER